MTDTQSICLFFDNVKITVIYDENNAAVAPISSIFPLRLIPVTLGSVSYTDMEKKHETPLSSCPASIRMRP